MPVSPSECLRLRSAAQSTGPQTADKAIGVAISGGFHNAYKMALSEECWVAKV